MRLTFFAPQSYSGLFQSCKVFVSGSFSLQRLVIIPLFENKEKVTEIIVARPQEDHFLILFYIFYEWNQNSSAAFSYRFAN